MSQANGNAAGTSQHQQQQQQQQQQSSSPGNASKTIAELLAAHQQLFPQWLLLVCSARKQSKTITRMFTGFRKVSYTIRVITWPIVTHMMRTAVWDSFTYPTSSAGFG